MHTKGQINDQFQAIESIKLQQVQCVLLVMEIRANTNTQTGVKKTLALCSLTVIELFFVTV